jgi:hypothetical protein
MVGSHTQDSNKFPARVDQVTMSMLTQMIQLQTNFGLSSLITSYQPFHQCV